MTVVLSKKESDLFQFHSGGRLRVLPAPPSDDRASLTVSNKHRLTLFSMGRLLLAMPTERLCQAAAKGMDASAPPFLIPSTSRAEYQMHSLELPQGVRGMLLSPDEQFVAVRLRASIWFYNVSAFSPASAASPKPAWQSPPSPSLSVVDFAWCPVPATPPASLSPGPSSLYFLYVLWDDGSVTELHVASRQSRGVLQACSGDRKQSYCLSAVVSAKRDFFLGCHESAIET